MFNYDHWLQVYMYDLMYADPETMEEEDWFWATKSFVDDYNRRSTPFPFQKHSLGFSYIHSEDYELYLNFNETETKSKPDPS